MNKDATQSSVNIALMDQIENLSSDYPTLTKGHESAGQELEHIKKHYSQTVLLYDVIKHCLSLDVGNPERNEALSKLRDALNLLELKNYIQLPPLIRDGKSIIVKKGVKNVPTLFDLDPDFLHKLAKSKITPQNLEILKDEIQNYLLQTCNKIISFTFPQETYPPDEGTTKVVTHVSNMKSEIKERKSLLEKQKQYNAGLFKLAFQQLIEYATGLEALVEKYRFSSHLLPHLSFLLLATKAYLMKLRCLKKEVLSYTYSQKSVPVLQKIQKEVEEKRERSVRSLAQVEHQLSAYEGLDPRFHELLKEYSNLQKDFKLFTRTS